MQHRIAACEGQGSYYLIIDGLHSSTIEAWPLCRDSEEGPWVAGNRDGQWSMGRDRKREARWDPRQQEAVEGSQGICSLEAA